MENTTLKQELSNMANHYMRHAEWELKRAKQATPGSKVAQEIMQAYKYNAGRAAAITEALAIVEQYIG